MNESLSGSRLRVLKIMISAGRRLAFWFTMQLIFLAFVHFLFGISWCVIVFVIGASATDWLERFLSI